MMMMSLFVLAETKNIDRCVIIGKPVCGGGVCVGGGGRAFCYTFIYSYAGGRGTVKDMCYEVRRAEACVV